MWLHSKEWRLQLYSSNAYLYMRSRSLVYLQVSNSSRSRSAIGLETICGYASSVSYDVNAWKHFLKEQFPVPISLRFILQTLHSVWRRWIAISTIDVTVRRVLTGCADSRAKNESWSAEETWNPAWWCLQLILCVRAFDVLPHILHAGPVEIFDSQLYSASQKWRLIGAFQINISWRETSVHIHISTRWCSATAWQSKTLFLTTGRYRLRSRRESRWTETSYVHTDRCNVSKYTLWLSRDNLATVNLVLSKTKSTEKQWWWYSCLLNDDV